jgi:predicted esterase
MRKLCPHGWIAALLTLALAGCSSIPSALDRTQSAQRLAVDAGWVWETIDAGHFKLAYAARPAKASAKTDLATTSVPPAMLTVYIEGDGLAWVSARRPSLDPTPVNPLALRLALKDSSGPVAYLGRPCQYVALQASAASNGAALGIGVGNTAAACTQRTWTTGRFSSEVIDSTNLALNHLIERITSETRIPHRLHLVGYSGGGTVALLAAAGRSDVVRVTTIAGNLDHAAWTQRLRLSPLSHSLNPPDFAVQLRGIPQTHWVGGKDDVVPLWVAESYEAKIGLTGSIRVKAGFDHVCCWVEEWNLE